jgi:hypothetical protein
VRQEIFDLADHAAVQVTASVVTAAGMEFRTRMAVKLLYTEPEARPDVELEIKPGPVTDPAATNRVRVETRPANRKFQVGGQEVIADKVVESYVDGMLTQKTWLSTQVPLGGVVLIEEPDGKVPMKLINFSRGQ